MIYTMKTECDNDQPGHRIKILEVKMDTYVFNTLRSKVSESSMPISPLNCTYSWLPDWRESIWRALFC
eukprot:1315662-Amorphochlora_amoeboformis.AAC.1